GQRACNGVARMLERKHTILQHEARIGNAAQNLGPQTQDRVDDLRAPIERAERDIATLDRRRRPRLRQNIWRPESEEVREVDDLLGQQWPLRYWDQHRVAEQVVDRFQPGAGRLAPGGDLNGGRLERERAKAVAFMWPTRSTRMSMRSLRTTSASPRSESSMVRLHFPALLRRCAVRSSSSGVSE